jgi:uncharacterized protein (DUF427 family)
MNTHQTAPTQFIEAAQRQQKGNRNMKEKQVKLPGPDHPISIHRNPARVVVSVAGRVVADTRNALTLREAAYPPVQYIPPEDVEFSKLERTDHVTYCPYKARSTRKSLCYVARSRDCLRTWRSSSWAFHGKVLPVNAA